VRCFSRAAAVAKAQLTHSHTQRAGPDGAAFYLAIWENTTEPFFLASRLASGEIIYCKCQCPAIRGACGHTTDAEGRASESDALSPTSCGASSMAEDEFNPELRAGLLDLADKYDQLANSASR
jgi:hypothetical protein